MYLYILINQGKLWHIARKRIGDEPVYYIIATTKSEPSARLILQALIQSLSKEN